MLLPHVPPGFTLEVGSLNFDNFVLYRAESLGACWACLRLYLFWRVVRNAVLAQLPKRHTVAAFGYLRLSSALASKVLLNGPLAMTAILGAWLAALLIAAYWYRAFEVPASPALPPPP